MESNGVLNGRREKVLFFEWRGSGLCISARDMFYTCLLDHRESRGTWGKALSVAAGKLSAPSTLCSIPKASCSANRAWERCVRNEPLFPKGKWGIERIRRSKQLGCARENGKKKGGEKKKEKEMLADCCGSCFLIQSIGHVTQQQELIILFNHLLDLCQMVSIESAANRERWTASNMPLELSRKCLRTESNKNLVSEQKGIHLKTMCINYTFPHRILTWHE